MDMESRAKQKRMGIHRFIKSFGYAFEGLSYAYTHEQNMVVHFSVALIVIILGLLFRISLFEWLICTILIGLVIATELINTSIEAVVDLISPQIHPLAKIAKDTASAAVFFFALTSMVAGGIIFIPKIVALW